MNLIYKNQETFEEKYLFFYPTPMVATANFMATFGDLSNFVVNASLQKLKEAHPEGDLDYLQTFEFEGKEFWIISDAPADYEVEKPHITFLMPEDY